MIKKTFRIVRKKWIRRYDQNRYPVMGKADIINILGQTNGYSTYLEIATRTTGWRFADVSSEIFKMRNRLLYNWPHGYSDGERIDYSSTHLNGIECLETVIAEKKSYDLVFIDSYHTYEASLIDLEYGLRLLNPNGIMVVHDCNPPHKKYTVPEFIDGAWLGETYLAFQDFVAMHPELEHCVVNTDWGVGLVWRKNDSKPKRIISFPKSPKIKSLDLHDWKTFRRHRKQLLNLISAKTFVRCFGP